MSTGAAARIAALGDLTTAGFLADQLAGGPRACDRSQAIRHGRTVWNDALESTLQRLLPLFTFRRKNLLAPAWGCRCAPHNARYGQEVRRLCGVLCLATARAGVTRCRWNGQRGTDRRCPRFELTFGHGSTADTQRPRLIALVLALWSAPAERSRQAIRRRFFPRTFLQRPYSPPVRPPWRATCRCPRYDLPSHRRARSRRRRRGCPT